MPFYVAVPPIQADLGSRAADLQWVVVAYGVVIAGFLLLGGGWGTSSGTGSCSSRG